MAGSVVDALILEAPYTSIRKATEGHVLAKVQSASTPPPGSTSVSRVRVRAQRFWDLNQMAAGYL